VARVKPVPPFNETPGRSHYISRNTANAALDPAKRKQIV
jgi:hypothetical protein